MPRASLPVSGVDRRPAQLAHQGVDALGAHHVLPGHPVAAPVGLAAHPAGEWNEGAPGRPHIWAEQWPDAGLSLGPRHSSHSALPASALVQHATLIAQVSARTQWR